MINTKKSKTIYFLTSLITILNYYIHRQNVWHVFDNASQKILLYFLFRILALCASWILFYTLIVRIQNLQHSVNTNDKTKASFFYVYLFINCWLLLWVWPGIFKGDEFYTIPRVVHLEIVWKQSLFTCLFYVIALMIFPYLAGITFCQLVIISYLASEIFGFIYQLLNKKILSWIVLLPFLFLPVLDNNLFTLRSSIISWLCAYIILKVYYEVHRRQFLGNKNLITVLLLSTFVFVWKVEYGYLVVLLLAFCLIQALLNKISFQSFWKLVFVFALSFFLLTLPNRLFQPKDNYVFSMILTPLSEIAQNNDLEEMKKKYPEDYEAVDKWTSMEEMRDTGRKINLPLPFWTAPVLNNKEKIQYLFSAARLCVAYRRDFINNRIYMYKITNGMIPNVINHTGFEDPNIVLGLKYNNEHFFNIHFKYTDPIMGGINRVRSISFLLCRDEHDYTSTNSFYKIVYNSFIPFIMLLIHLISSLFKKDYISVSLDLAILLIVPIVFFTAPADFWMYYMPFYLMSYVLLTIYLITFIDTVLFKNSMRIKAF